MNNRYLYRAKRTDNLEWVEGNIMTYNDRCFIVPKFGISCIEEHKNLMGDNMISLYAFEVDPSTICQCTGLKDKNGKLIWENDVVKCVDVNAETEFFAVVEFGNPNGFYSWGYQLKHIWGDEPNLDILLWIDMEETGATCEIIGNIFDNPEQLKAGDGE